MALICLQLVSVLLEKYTCIFESLLEMPSKKIVLKLFSLDTFGLLDAKVSELMFETQNAKAYLYMEMLSKKVLKDQE